MGFGQELGAKEIKVAWPYLLFLWPSPRDEKCSRKNFKKSKNVKCFAEI